MPRPCWLALLAVACASSPAPPVSLAGEPAPPERAAAPASLAALAETGQVHWEPDIHSPRPETLPPGTEADLLSRCGEGDTALGSLAWRLAHRQAQGLAPPDPAELPFFLRARGVPYVWPHTWSVTASLLEPRDLATRLDRWLSSQPSERLRRCGIAMTRGDDGKDIVVATAATVLAETAPFPTRARLGEWLAFETRLRVEASHAKAVVLGPRGPPKTVPTTLRGNRARARFAVDRAGAWRVQMLATVAGGPRPVAEAWVFVDIAPPTSFASIPAPGEQAAASSVAPDDAVYAMLNAARRLEGLPPLRRDPRLDAVARRHVEAMRRAGRLAHDLGRGTVDQRLSDQGLDVERPGENLAHARSPERAHRALWSSPSHRGNLLDAQYGAVGVGVLTDRDGSAWVCQVFARR